MFKEAFAGVILLCIFFFFCRALLRKSKKMTAILIFTILCISCIANIVYNSLNIFPDFYMDIVNGRFRYGTFSGNLFAYSDEFMFQDEIIFPVLKNRSVTLDSQAGFYEKFFTLYADSVSVTDISYENRQAIFSRIKDFSFCHEFSCIGIMDYVTDKIPDELTSSFEEEVYPTLYINISSLKNNQSLVVLMDENYTVYVMSESYFKEVTGGNTNV